jgi:hypothetical protein
MTPTPPPREEAEPIDAEFEPARAGSTRLSDRPASGRGVSRMEAGAWAAGAVVLGAIAAVLAVNAGVGRPQGAGTEEIATRVASAETAISDLETRLEAESARLAGTETVAMSARQQVAAINQQLAALVGASPGLGGDGPPLGRLIARVEQLEESLAEDASAPRTTRQMQRALRELSDQVAALDEASTDFTTALSRRQAALAAVEEAVEQLTADVDGMEARLAETEKLRPELGEVRRSMSDLSTSAETARAPVLAAAAEARLVKALADLTTAAEKGRPFPSQHQTLAKLLPEDADIAALREPARRGAPSLAELRRDLDAPLRSAQTAAAAQTDDGWNWLRGAVSGLVTIRRTGADDRTSTLLRQAEEAIDAGDARAAVTAIDGLEPAPRAALAGWRDKAARRADLDEQIAALNARLLRNGVDTPEGG